MLKLARIESTLIKIYCKTYLIKWMVTPSNEHKIYVRKLSSAISKISLQQTTSKEPRVRNKVEETNVRMVSGERNGELQKESEPAWSGETAIKIKATGWKSGAAIVGDEEIRERWPRKLPTTRVIPLISGLTSRLAPYTRYTRTRKNKQHRYRTQRLTTSTVFTVDLYVLPDHSAPSLPPT